MPIAAAPQVGGAVAAVAAVADVDTLRAAPPKAPRPKTQKGGGGDAGFAEFWDAFGLKLDKAGALKSWKRLGDDDRAAATEGAKRYAAWRAANPTAKPKWAQGWLTDRRWEDDLADATGPNADGLAPAEGLCRRWTATEFEVWVRRARAKFSKPEHPDPAYYAGAFALYEEYRDLVEAGPVGPDFPLDIQDEVKWGAGLGYFSTGATVRERAGWMREAVSRHRGDRFFRARYPRLADALSARGEHQHEITRYGGNPNAQSPWR